MTRKRSPILELEGVERKFTSSKELNPLCNIIANYLKDKGVNTRSVYNAFIYFMFALANYTYNNPDRYIFFGGRNLEGYVYKPDGLTRYLTIAGRKPLWFDNPHLRDEPKPETFLRYYDIQKNEIKEFKKLLEEFIDNLTFDAMDSESKATETLKNIKGLKDRKED